MVTYFYLQNSLKFLVINFLNFFERFLNLKFKALIFNVLWTNIYKGLQNLENVIYGQPLITSVLNTIRLKNVQNCKAENSTKNSFP